MQKIEKRKILFVAVVLVLCLFSLSYFLIQREKIDNQQETYGEQHVPVEFSAWLVDWDWKSGLENVNLWTKNMRSLQLFAAYFNHEAELLITNDFKDMMLEFSKTKTNLKSQDVFLTIVNDRIQLDGSSIQKDPELIDQLVKTDESRKHHIEKIIELIQEYNLDGVEIDYEQVSQEDWNSLLTFFEQLSIQLQDMGKQLRIVLEPSAPIESLQLPEGPIYVIMAYNLYGYHSGPGPKADPNLITSVAKKLIDLNSTDHYLALSVGGFDWREDGTITALTEEKAVRLTGLSSKPVERDEISGSLFFEYMDGDGQKHTVWYADQITLRRWIKVAEDLGIHKIAIWRLGEIEQTTIEYLSGI